MDERTRSRTGETPVTPAGPGALPPGLGGASAARATNGLLALGAAAVLSIYSAGYLRTRSAAQRFEGESLQRRPPVPMHVPEPSASPVAPAVLPTTAAPPAGATRSVTRTPSPLDSSATRPSAATNSPAPASVPNAAAAQPDSSRPSTSAIVEALAAMASTDTTPTSGAAVPPLSTPTDSAAKAAQADSATEQRQGWRDGLYTGWGTSRHGDIQAAVEIKAGRIVSAYITQCLTRYSCSWISALPPQVVTRQSPEVDYVSGATQSTNAFYYAVVEALAKAK